MADKEVRFDLYCKTCAFKSREGYEPPCCYCLASLSNDDSHKPVYWKAADGRNRAIKFSDWCPWCRYENSDKESQPCSECLTHVVDDKEEPYNFAPKKGDSE